MDGNVLLMNCVSIQGFFLSSKIFFPLDVHSLRTDAYVCMNSHFFVCINVYVYACIVCGNSISKAKLVEQLL